MTDPKYDKAMKIGIENALEILEEHLDVCKNTFTTTKGQGYIDGIQYAIEIVKLNITNKYER